ncbi:unnamed protein product [Bubo scandiacus]
MRVSFPPPRLPLRTHSSSSSSSSLLLLLFPPPPPPPPPPSSSSSSPPLPARSLPFTRPPRQGPRGVRPPGAAARSRAGLRGGGGTGGTDGAPGGGAPPPRSHLHRPGTGPGCPGAARLLVGRQPGTSAGQSLKMPFFIPKRVPCGQAGGGETSGGRPHLALSPTGPGPPRPSPAAPGGSSCCCRPRGSSSPAPGPSSCRPAEPAAAAPPRPPAAPSCPPLSPSRARRRPRCSRSPSTGPSPPSRNPPAAGGAAPPAQELAGSLGPAPPGETGEPRREHFDRLIRQSKLWCYAKGFNLDGKSLRHGGRTEPQKTPRRNAKKGNTPCKRLGSAGPTPPRNFSLMGNFPCTPSLVVGEDGDLCPASSLGVKNSWALSKTHPLWSWHLGGNAIPVPPSLKFRGYSLEDL